MLAYYWQLYLQNALQQSGGQLPLPFLPGSMPGGMAGPNFMGAMPFPGQLPMQSQHMQMQQPHMHLPMQMQQPMTFSGGQGLDIASRKRGAEAPGGGMPKKGRKARNENKVCHGLWRECLHEHLVLHDVEQMGFMHA